MPVRIYDIAKKLGIENKEVLVKAKELGISAARVPSSSLDKITAEYLESHLKPAAPAGAEASPIASTPAPILLVSALAQPPPAPGSPAETTARPAPPEVPLEGAPTSAGPQTPLEAA